MSSKVTPVKLINNQLYAVGYYSVYHLCQFVKVSDKGYNFIVIGSENYFLKRKIYPTKNTNTFFVSKKLSIRQDFENTNIKDRYKIVSRRLKIKKLLQKLELNETHKE